MTTRYVDNRQSVAIDRNAVGVEAVRFMKGRKLARSASIWPEPE